MQLCVLVTVAFLLSCKKAVINWIDIIFIAFFVLFLHTNSLKIGFFETVIMIRGAATEAQIRLTTVTSQVGPRIAFRWQAACRFLNEHNLSKI